ncbi:trypsin-like serine protease [Longispora sp. K20-0274]|uniref:trypsin-like serine protease n=1 Tax=Longispora sp. K20-0274 TaxID=3088255 RepID=UPI00399A24DC
MRITTTRLALWLAGASATAVLVAAAPAGAVTSNGVPDAGAHPYVGAMLAGADDPYTRCSGTLLSSTVFLTAAHCTDDLLAEGRTRAYVTFDEHYVRGGSTLHAGTMHEDPAYAVGNGHDAHDIAVIVLDSPVTMTRYGHLPAAGALDALAAKGGLTTARFDVVGYGTEEAQRGPGGHTFPGGDSRMRASAEFDSLNPYWVRLSQNQHAGDGGGCYGDSGGPDFLDGTDLVAGTTITGDGPCYATNVIYRLDTDSARAFLGAFVPLP